MQAPSVTGTPNALGSLCVAAATTLVLAAQGQVAFPDQYIQDVVWTEGVHHYTLAQPIISGSTGSAPTIITGTADAEFVSGTSVHLTDGFHAGNFTDGGRFRARIDDGIDSADAVAIITPSPDAIVDGMLHVKKWEKLEVGLKLHQPYLDAIQTFYDHYYPSDPSEFFGNIPEPGSVDPVHDLNPYADDSLQVYMVLTDPDGGQRMKWAFYMREVKWDESVDQDTAQTVDDPEHPLDPYRMRFRFAPDKEGSWQFRIHIRAPHTLDENNTPLPEVNYATYSFHCDPPPEGKHGPLHVNANNHRMLQHEDGTSFFGIGPNFGDVKHAEGDFPGDWDRFYRRDMNVIKESMDSLHSVGGNFVRMLHSQQHFAFEVVNLGVYDRYQGLSICSVGYYSGRKANCQHQSWSFDQLLEHAALNNIYMQLCVEPDKPADGNDYLWGATPYVTQFLNTARDTTGTYPLRNYFYKKGWPSTRDDVNTSADRNVFYFWKRKYKYLMNRWGYSPHLAIIEPINEIDKMLGYDVDIQLTDSSYVCEDNRLPWPVQDSLPETLDAWLSDIKDFMTGPVNTNNPVYSPLGEKKLLTISYALNDPAKGDRLSFYKPFYNPKVDLMDAHMYVGPESSDANTPDGYVNFLVSNTHGFLNRTPGILYPVKPFNAGESNYMTNLPGWGPEIEKIFHNYDVTFHNEIWANAFSGKFVTGNTWHWERVFWWPDAVKRAPPDLTNEFYFSEDHQFGNSLGDINEILVNGAPLLVKNRSLYHHFKPLSDLLGNASIQDFQFFDDVLIPRRVPQVYTEPNELESYYLINAQQTMAVGWAHSRNAWVMNNYYLRSSQQNFLGCDAPDPAASRYLHLAGFDNDYDYYITWFPTHQNTDVTPPSRTDPIPHTTDPDSLIRIHNGTITIDLLDQFGGVANNYLDTLRSDYAFVIAPSPISKSRLSHAVDPVVETRWDFSMYPNPTRDALSLRFSDETPKEITVCDLAGRRILSRSSVTSSIQTLAIDDWAKGVYAVNVSTGSNSRTKKLVVH